MLQPVRGWFKVGFMRDGFLGYNASLMLDVVVCALVLVVPVILYSLFQVRFRKRFELHRRLQMTLAVVLLLAVGAFEVDLQIVHGGWENVVAKRQPPLDADGMAFVRRVLWVHLVFAISTPILWGITLWMAWRRFPRPTTPGQHSHLHRQLGWISTVDLVMTSVTGLIFYYYAFIENAA